MVEVQINNIKEASMLNPLFSSKKSINRPATQAKELFPRKKEKLSPQSLNRHLATQKLVNFEPRKYPFPNQPIPNNCIYKTTVSVNNLLGDNMKKLTKISHPNIITVKKILRSSIKCSPGKLSVNNYSLIYEVVPYQLKYVGCGVESLQKIYRKVTASDFRQIITSVSMFLNRNQVYHTIKLADIGITEQGTLKIYIPPEIIIRPFELPKDRQQLQRNNEKLISWCQTTFTNSEISEYLDDEQSQKPHMSQVKCKKCQSQSQSQIESQDQFELERKPCLGSSKDLTKNYLQSTALKSSCKSFQSDLSKMAAFQKEKIKKIDNEIKNIKERLHIHNDKDKTKDSNNKVLIQNRPSSNIAKKPSIFESQRLIKRETKDQLKFNEKDNRRYRESIQQNINCINIYNHSNKNIQFNPKESKRLSNNPVISYKILPLKDSIPLTEEHTPFTPSYMNNNYNHILEHHGGYFDNPFDGIQNEESFDTYDIEVKEAKEEPQQPKYRQTLNNLEKNSSENNIMNHKNAKREAQAENNNKKINQNHVSGHHLSTESAGPLQFKHFVNTYIKPQFLAKKSNIYQDPMEEDSQPSNHKHKHQTNQIQSQMTLGVPKNKSSLPKQRRIVQETKQRTDSQEKIHRIQSDKRLTVLTMPQIGDYTSGNFLKGKEPKFNYSRVQQIVKKSQNALRLLHKAREGGNSNIRGRMSP